MKTLLLICLICLLPGAALALQDNSVERARQADRYLAATPPESLLRDVAEQMAPNLPPEHREQFKDLLLKHLDLPVVTKTIRAALVKIFSADELAALADFYGSAVGRSATRKMGTYMAEVMPTIQDEISKAYERAISQAGQSGTKGKEEGK